ncbi:hypothetical protein CC80DRAFT_74104 [Byssothecium circinans]|uniref:HTH La-type RNA-binding domain-containing protein n=1 Tax=Byssothecium circinans TaxID=147558 RepID=A0A6A5TVG0_9PLEO|nr:hypothetical protein CC80DRAFT_74104 [Byssothecium circinans]
MASTTPQRSGSEAAAPATFSYAQAAKGLSAQPSSAASKASSGSATPAKDSQVSTIPAAAVISWAEDAEANEARSEPNAASREPRTQPAAPATKSAPTPQDATTSTVSSPDLGASTASTVTKDDDVSSIPNTSSDSTWDNKSQASTSVEKSVGSLDKPAEKAEGKKGKGKGKNADKLPSKPLHEAPPPAVNIWKQRAEEARAKTVQRPAPAKPASIAASGAPNGAPPGPATTTQAKAASDSSSKEKPVKGREEEKSSQARKDSKLEGDADKTRKTGKGRSQEKDLRPTQPALPLMPARDQEAWPTPETAVDEERKKANEKSDKPEQEHKDNSAPKTKWNKLPINPTVVFNTPMPNGASSRRGGRGPGRGGAQVGGRTGGFDASNSAQTEKDGFAATSLQNGDVPRRGRTDGPARDASPKERRNISAGSAPKEKAPIVNGDKFTKAAGSDVEAPSRRPGDSATNFQMSGQNNTYPRHFPTGRPNKPRRGDFQGQERRKDGDSVSPTKENGAFGGRRNSTAMQTEGKRLRQGKLNKLDSRLPTTDNGEQRGSGYADGQVPHSKRGTDRPFGSYSGRERRGGGRGGRGNYQNGHQYTNGHNPSMKPPYAGPLSPTTFNPDPTAYFSPPPNRYRNGPRSQSGTNENMYRMPGPYGGPQQVPPIQTFMNPPYEYPVPQPMSAVPFGQFGFDPLALFSMVTMQMEYYFSLENLIKDMYLRKHMDTKGFVFLSVIADFNRIKQLTEDVELIKSVCYQSRVIDYRIGNDGKDRVRCREGWEKFVLPVADRDASVQNEGPEETCTSPHYRRCMSCTVTLVEVH